MRSNQTKKTTTHKGKQVTVEDVKSEFLLELAAGYAYWKSRAAELPTTDRDQATEFACAYEKMLCAFTGTGQQ